MAPAPAGSSSGGPPGGPPGGGDTARLAGGAGLIFAGGIADRGLRFVLKWFLSGVVGPAGLGLYELANVIARTVSAFATLGVDDGALLFASRYRKTAEHARLKGTLVVAGAIIVVTGLTASFGLWAAATWGPWWADDPEARAAVRWTAPAIVGWSLVLLAQGLNRAAKDMRGIVVTKQIAMPALMLTGVLVVVGLLDAGVLAAIQVMSGATVVSGLLGLAWAGRHYWSVVRDPKTEAHLEVGQLLKFSIPQSFTQAAWRLNQSMDVLMLGWLSTREEVGLYAIAAALASIGAVPANAVTSVFSSFIAELVYVKELERLDRLLKTVTRWLLIAAAPGYLILFLLPDQVLRIYDPAYLASITPLLVLVAAQMLNTICVPAMNTIPMAGYSMLNLANGVIALSLNIGLNIVLIPRYGSVGAAAATGITLVLWSGWRLFEVKWLLQCFPFGSRTLGLLGLAIGGAVALKLGGQSWPVLWRVAATAGLVVAFGVAAGTFGRTADDDALIGQVKRKVKRMLGRR